MPINYREELMKKIQKLLSGEWDVPSFTKEYYNFYLEQVPSNVLTDSEAEFFGLVQEKLDWTAENPAHEEQKDGWADQKTYIEWLRNNTREFLKDENNWNKNSQNNFDWESNKPK